MSSLRHIAVVVKDLEKAAEFYQKVFDLKYVGRDDLEIGSGIYLSDGVVNLALLKYKVAEGSGKSDMEGFVGAHHFGFQVDDIAEALGFGAKSLFLANATSPPPPPPPPAPPPAPLLA